MKTDFVLDARGIALRLCFVANSLPALVAGCAQVQDPAQKSTPAATTPAQKVSASTAPDDPFGTGAGEIRFGRSSAPPKPAGIVRLAAYNVENLFDDKDDPTLSGQYDDLGLTSTDSQCRNVAAAIKALDADVMILEEVEGEEALRWFRDTYLQGLGYDHLRSIEAGYERGVEQSVLSRFPIKEASIHSRERIDDMKALQVGEGWATPRSASSAPDFFGRDPIRAVIDGPGDYELIIYGVHFKAGGGGDNDAQREAESMQVREWVKADLAANPDANVAVLGDFNATPLQRAYALQLQGNTKDGDGAGVLIGAYNFRDQERPKEEYRTHVSGRSIDYIVMSDGLAADVVPASFVVVGTPFPGEEQQRRVLAWIKKGYPRGQEPQRHPQQASDHYPIAVDLDPSKEAAAKEAAGANPLPPANAN
ncbi:MAG: endonuclease/exonuclease/phosphatase family protein [Planctomycetota bacterium]|nr:endonuclease/exonuclease/phosphatase family protein [Planctomycetota bacterium]MDA1105578.1 endonuclease/exonuclease/phosphatase family protein [Planctomycetota bacterium]